MQKLTGSLTIPGDKSISHRALILSSMAVGKTEITNLLEADDIRSTIKILKQLGIRIYKKNSNWFVHGNGTNGFIQPKNVLDAKNSGTSARTLIGAVSSNPITCKFKGDKSLSKRSMSRVTTYLDILGAKINLTKNNYLPLEIEGNSNMVPRKIIIEKPSAQIKTALIFAGLNISGKFKIIERVQTRDHTEKLLKYLNISYKRNKRKNGFNEIELNGPYEILPRNISVVGDPSSAAFFVVGALITPGSKIILKNVSLNNTRTAYIDVLKKMGGKIKIIRNKDISGEACGSIYAEYSKLKGTNINRSLSPFLIDEYPIISIAASCATGTTVMKGLNELRHKESDRINSIVSNLKKAGVNVESKNDDIRIYGNTNFKNKTVKIKSFDDHRIACAFMILRLINKNIEIDNEKCVSISYPKFKKDLKSLLKNI